MSSAEDPEKILDQAMIEMQEDLVKMRQASAQVRHPCQHHMMPSFHALTSCSTGPCFPEAGGSKVQAGAGHCGTVAGLCTPVTPSVRLTCVRMLQDDWLRRAELAVAKGEDELAKEALRRRKTFQVLLAPYLAASGGPSALQATPVHSRRHSPHGPSCNSLPSLS